MLTCERNPAAFAETYLKNLNTAFGSWGNTELYEWVFQRECGSFAPEQLILRDESNEVLAGSGVSYRRLILPNGNAMDVGIMTGSWTLPAARGRGCFTRIIEESRLLCADRGCGLLLAFVTQDNPSRRALERAGSALFPSRYVFGTVEDSPSLPVSIREQAELREPLEAERSGTVHFAYPTGEAFEGQHLQRPHETATLQVGRAIAIIERTADTDRIGALLLNGEERENVVNSIASWSTRQSRRFFAFWMGESDPTALDFGPGFVTALVADGSALGSALGVDGTPTAEDSARLGESNSGLFLGCAWAIDSGDRM